MKNLALISILFLVGCANTTPMSPNRQAQNIDVSKQSVILMTVDIGRAEASRFIPSPTAVGFIKQGSQEKPESVVFKVDAEAGTSDSETHNQYLFRMPLDPGKYRLMSIAGMASAFPIIASFQLPLFIDVDVAPNSITYVGRITATMRPRVGNEFRAGSLFPLLDQSIAGISGNTFDVSVTDAEQDDIPKFKSRFSSLATMDIKKVILPPFDRTRAQAWFDGIPQLPPSTKEANQVETKQANVK